MSPGQHASRLAPWEELRFFLRPNVIVTGPFGSSVWVSVAPNNPNRVALYLSASADVRLSTDPETNVNGGIFLSNATLPLVVRQATDGLLCTSEWFALGSAGGYVTAIEQSLREWPGR